MKNGDLYKTSHALMKISAWHIDKSRDRIEKCDTLFNKVEVV